MTFITNDRDRAKAIDATLKDVAEAAEMRRIHPTDKVEVYRRIEKWAGQKAVEQVKINDREGVPE